MADNLTTQSATPATIPANVDIATDDAGAGGHVQIVKLAVSTDGSATPLTANNTDGLLVNLGSNNDVTVTGSVTANAGTNLNTSALALESGGNLAAAATSLATLDNAISGSEMQVDVVAALPAGTNNIGDVDVASIAAGDNNIGNVDIVTMPAVTNGGTFVVQENGAALTALQLIDDAVYTDGTGTPSKAIGVAGTDGTNPQIIKTDASGELQVDVLTMPTVAVTQSGTWDEVGINDSGNSITVDDGGSTLTVDGTVTANLAAGTNNIGDVDVLSLPAIPAGTNNIGDVDILTIAAGDNNIGNVDIVSLPALPAGTNNIGDVDVFSNTAKDGSGTRYQPLVDTDGHLQIDVLSGGGGGTQYTEGDTDASVTGTAVMWEDGSDTLRVASAAKPLPVEIIAGGGSGGTSAADDADFTDGTTAGTPAMGVYEGTPSTVTDGDLGVVGITEDRRLKTSAVVTSSALPSGASTSAKQDTIIGHLDGVEGILTTIDGDTSNISTKIDTLAGAVSGTEMQVDVLTMPTVTVNAHAVTNAGTFAVQVDGNALTALQLIDDTVATLGTTTYTETTTKGTIIGAVRRDADTTLVDTTNEIGPLQMNAAGQLKVEAFSGETLPVSLASVPSHAVTNAGTFAVQVDGSALTALQLIDDTIKVDDAAFTPGTTSVSMAGFQADESSTDSVDEGDAGAARMTLDRKVIVNPQPHTAGGLSVFNANSGDTFTALTNSAQAVKASAGQLYGWYMYNPNTSAVFVIFYNVASGSVTVGTTTAHMILPLPALSGANLIGAHGIPFDTAITVAAATTAGGNSAPTTALEVTLFYK